MQRKNEAVNLNCGLAQQKGDLYIITFTDSDNFIVNTKEKLDHLKFMRDNFNKYCSGKATLGRYKMIEEIK